jgi:hypothetical protein
MVNAQHPTSTSELKANRIEKTLKFMLHRGLFIGIAVMLVVLPSCKGHKHCDAYSNAYSKKKKRGGLVFSLEQKTTRSYTVGV